VIGSVVELGVKVGEIVVETGKKAINMVQDGLVYLAEVQKCIVETAWGYIEKACEVIVSAIVNAINWFVDWIWGAIRAGLDYVLSPIVNAMDSWVGGICNAIAIGFEEYVSAQEKGGGFDVGKATERIEKAIFGPAYCIVKPVLDTIKWVTDLIKPLMDVISDLLDQVTDFVSNIIMMAIAGSNPDASQYESLFSADMGSDEISNVVGSEAKSNTEETKWEVIQLSLTFISLIMGACTLALTDGTGAMGALVAIIAVIFTTIAAGRVDMYHPQSAKYNIMLFGLALAGIGLVSSFAGLIILGWGLQAAIPITGIVCGGIALYLGVSKLQEM
ncbi:MAG: hypothetical protein QMC80_05835, partial [Thermoplasmatales archaeon]|nr:hypothetical protein [Thermoplasmatales archaeon]